MPPLEGSIDTRQVLDAMADTLRGVLAVVDQPQPYPWQSGALKQQIREDLTAYDLLCLDDLAASGPSPARPEDGRPAGSSHAQDDSSSETHSSTEDT